MNERTADSYHTLYCLSGLSTAQHHIYPSRARKAQALSIWKDSGENIYHYSFDNLSSNYQICLTPSFGELSLQTWSVGRKKKVPQESLGLLVPIALSVHFSRRSLFFVLTLHSKLECDTSFDKFDYHSHGGNY
jgi:hypothetical protein